jgi:hypothetical protein
MRYAVLAVLWTIVFSGASTASAQNDSVNADAVRKALLATAIWHVDRNTGTTFWHFEMRGDTLWGKYSSADGRGMRDVRTKVTNDGLILTDSNGDQIVLKYDPQDIQYPFKGSDTQGTKYEFTPK